MRCEIAIVASIRFVVRPSTGSQHRNSGLASKRAKSWPLSKNSFSRLSPFLGDSLDRRIVISENYK